MQDQEDTTCSLTFSSSSSSSSLLPTSLPNSSLFSSSDSSTIRQQRLDFLAAFGVEAFSNPNTNASSTSDESANGLPKNHLNPAFARQKNVEQAKAGDDKTANTTKRQEQIEELIDKQQSNQTSHAPLHVRASVVGELKHLCWYADAWKTKWPSQMNVATGQIFPAIRPKQLSNWLFLNIDHLKEYKLPRSITVVQHKTKKETITKVLENLYDFIMEELRVALPSFVQGRVVLEKDRASFMAFFRARNNADKQSYIGIPRFYGLSRFPLPNEVYMHWVGEGDFLPDLDTNPQNPFAYFNPSIRPRSRVQEDAIASYQNHLHPRFGGGGCIVLNCGEGKTFVAAQCIHKTLGRVSAAKRTRLVWVVDSTELAQQGHDELVRFLPRIKATVIGGSKTIPTSEYEQYDVFVVLVQKMPWVQFPAHVRNEVRMVVIDECHHGAASSFITTLQSFEPQFTLGLSATPTRSDGMSFLMHWFIGPIVYVHYRPKTALPTSSVFLNPTEAFPFFKDQAPRIVSRTGEESVDWIGLQALVGREYTRVAAVLDLVLRHHYRYPHLQAVVFCQFKWQCKAIAEILNLLLGANQEEIAHEEQEATQRDRAERAAERKRKRKEEEGLKGRNTPLDNAIALLDDADADADAPPVKKRKKAKGKPSQPFLETAAAATHSSLPLPPIRPRAVAYYGDLTSSVRRLHLQTSAILVSTKEMLEEGIDLPRLAFVALVGLWMNIEQMFGRAGRSADYADHALIVDFQEEACDKLKSVFYKHKHQYKDASHHISSFSYNPDSPLFFKKIASQEQSDRNNTSSTGRLAPLSKDVQEKLSTHIFQDGILEKHRQEDVEKKAMAREREKQNMTRVRRMIAKAHAHRTSVLDGNNNGITPGGKKGGRHTAFSWQGIRTRPVQDQKEKEKKAE